MSVLHEGRAGLGGLRNEHARGPLRYGPSGSERRDCSDRWCSEGVVLGESSSRPDRHLLKSSARVSNERNERHARCAEQEQCRGDMLSG